MKAIVYKEYGPPGVLRMAELPKPIPKKKEMLIRVHASTVTAGSVWVRKGGYPDSLFYTFLLRCFTGFFGPRRQVTGFEFSGVVEAVGEGVRSFAVGDQVFGTTTGLPAGAYAEYICVPEKHKRGVMIRKDEELDFADAAALPIGGMTALNLLNKARAQRGDHVLIYGASGSVGSYALQLSKIFGCTVTAACSLPNFHLVRSLGADRMIDYRGLSPFTCNERFDIVFDAVGKLSAPMQKALLAPKGCAVSVRQLTREKEELLILLQQLVRAGKLKPLIDRVYPIEDIAKAHEYVETGRKKGNVVLRGFSAAHPH